MKEFQFSDLKIPVISNVEARPYPPGKVAELLAEQITHSVNWTETIRYLWGKGEEDFQEIGPGKVLTGLVRQIKRLAEPLTEGTKPEAAASALSEEQPRAKSEPGASGDQAATGGITVQSLGNEAFKRDYGLKYPYLAGSMSEGTGSKELVVKMGQAGLLGFLWSGGRQIQAVEDDLRHVQSKLKKDEPYGGNLICNLIEPEKEEAVTDLYLRMGVRNVEAIAFLQMTPSLVRYRVKGLRRGADGKVETSNRIIAKVTRPEVATLFMNPPPERTLRQLIDAGKITAAEAELAREVPMSHDVCVEADSGGVTDQGVAYALMPAMLRLRDDIQARRHYAKPIRVGASGGIGAPEAAAAAFILGADFIMTGSINQCTVQAGISEMVKDLLQTINVQDTAYAPAEEMFEMGVKVQVLKKGLFFPARANKLYTIYQQYGSVDEIDEKTKKQIEDKYFKKSLVTVWNEIKSNHLGANTETIQKVERNPKQKMALLFKWYLNQGTRLALSGAGDRKVDFQVYCGSAMGTFNQWVKGTPQESWRNRHVDQIAEKIMLGAAEILNHRFHQFTSA